MTILVSEAQGFSMEHGRACGPHEETKIIFVVAPAKAEVQVGPEKAELPLPHLPGIAGLGWSSGERKLFGLKTE